MSQFYTIKELESLSGVKAHTIRIWEKRYELVQPHRTDTNLRRYDTDQLKKILNVALLLRNGHKVSKVAEYSPEDLKKAIGSLNDENKFDLGIQNQIQLLINAMISYDEVAFEKVFSTSILRYGLTDTFVKVLYPFMNQVGMMWCTDDVDPCQEHFVSNQVRQKLFCAIDGIIPEIKTEETWLLFLPDDEYHELGLLMSYFLIRSTGKRVIYLGQNVPVNDLDKAVSGGGATKLLSFLVRARDLSYYQEFQQSMMERFPDQEIHLACHSMIPLQSQANCKMLHSVNDLLDIL